MNINKIFERLLEISFILYYLKRLPAAAQPSCFPFNGNSIYFSLSYFHHYPFYFYLEYFLLGYSDSVFKD